MQILRGVVLLVLACLTALCAGRHVDLVVRADAHGCGDACCCAPPEPSAAPACCAKDARDALPRLVAACGCGGPGELHLAIDVGPWTLPPAPDASLVARREPPALAAAREPASWRAEPPTPPPRS